MTVEIVAQVSEAIEELSAAETADRRRLDVIEAARRSTDPRVPAGRLLGMKPDEIGEVIVDTRGLIVTNARTGPSVIIVSPDKPDANGNSGVLLFEPTPRAARSSRLPVYTPPESRARRARAALRRKPRAPRVEAPLTDGPDYATDERLRSFEAELAEARVGLEAAPDGTGEKTMFKDRVSALEKLVRARRWQLRSAWLQDHPEPPPARELSLYTDVYGWARRVVAATSDVEIRTIVAAYCERRPQYVSMWLRPESAPRELAAAEQWFAKRDLPLPVLEGEAA